jgi:ketosteroid isomerase-like protein
MSQQNVEIVRRAVDGYNEAGEPPWEALDIDIEWVIDSAAWVGGTYRGHDGVRAMLGRLAEAFDRFQLDFDRYVDAGDSVVAVGRAIIRGGSSGVIAGQPLGYVFRLRDGRIAAARSYLQPSEALKAVGLGEEPGPSPVPQRYPAETRVRWPPTWKGSES